jgi:hypothetical protein
MMSQILRIFRKDVRHFWIEILASVLALSAYIWRVLHEWANPLAASDLPNFLRGLLMALGPMSWCLLVVRVIQDETLVGDRQFWVTRPYEWKKLLAAKVLFVLLFVNVPLLVANAIFLRNSGFSPTGYLVGLLWIQLSIIVVLVLPAACVSVVTSTVVQVILWTLGIGTYIAAVASLSSLIPDSHIPTPSSGSSEVISMGLFAAALLGIVLWQYTQRRPWIPRVFIFGIAVVLAGAGLMPTTTAKQIARAYPPLTGGEQPPFRLTPVPPKPSAEDPSQSQATEKKLELSIPIRFTGVAADSLVAVAGTRVTIRTRNGDQFTSKWVNDGTEVWPGEQTDSVSSEIDRSFFEQTRFVPVSLRIIFAFTEYNEINTREIITRAGEFPIDGIGICWVSSPQAEYWSRDIIGCRSPLKSPAILVHFDTARSTCPHVPGKSEAPPSTRYTSSGSLSDATGLAELAIIPIQSFDLRFSQPHNPDDPNDKTVLPGVCPETPITLSTPRVARSASTEIEIDDADLRDYLPPPVRVRLR